MNAMKRILALILCVAAFSLAPACASRSMESSYDDTEYSGQIEGTFPQVPLITKGLNDIREIIGGEWEYVFVAGDAIFTSGGYYTIEGICEYVLKTQGVAAEGTVADFVRKDGYAVAVYRMPLPDKSARFYAVYAPYAGGNYSLIDLGEHNSAFARIEQADEEIKISFDGDEFIGSFGVRIPSETPSDISASLEGGVITAEADGVRVSITAEDIKGAIGEFSQIEKKRAQSGQAVDPEIVAVKICGGELFAVLGDEPDTFAGLRDVNDGVPPIIVRIDINGGVSYKLCGLVDFTGYSVYKVVKI